MEIPGQNSLADDQNLIWFAVQAKPRHEKIACENLARQCFNPYLPKILTKKRSNGRWVLVEECLFPGYLFIHVDPATTSLSPVRSTLGVSKLVRFGSQLKPVPDDIINFIRQREDDQAAAYIEPEIALKLGDTVEILEGPFAGLKAVFQARRAQDRVILLLDFLGKTNSVALHNDQIQISP